MENTALKNAIIDLDERILTLDKLTGLIDQVNTFCKSQWCHVSVVIRQIFVKGGGG